MSDQTGIQNRAYYAQRAAEELEAAVTARDEEAAEAHRKLQRIYLERASVGDRETLVRDEIG